MKNWSDWMGVVASVACAIHCAAMPFVAMFLPMLGLSFLIDDSFHRVMVIVCSAFAITAFIPGFRRHRRWLPIGVGVLGLSLISTAAFALEDQCCATCEALAASIATEESEAGKTEAQESETEKTAVVCTEACCNPPKDEATLDVATTTTETASIMGPLAPWITPIGGLLLVAAHLTNHRFTCRCGCCPEDSNTDDLKPSELPIA